ncbi:MAG: four helix bundle protein [Deltaproteobacteria bacterium]|nr:MAG: four helix bundle protein [Deltaproteobacteria bacterium]
MIHSYKELIVWQRAMDLVVAIYELVEYFPKEEIFVLSAQMRKAAISIPSNIAEGRFRGTRKDFLQFLRIAYASGAELETQCEISKRLKKTKKLDCSKVDDLLIQVMKMLNKMIANLNPKS